MLLSSELWQLNRTWVFQGHGASLQPQTMLLDEGHERLYVGAKNTLFSLSLDRVNVHQKEVGLFSSPPCLLGSETYWTHISTECVFMGIKQYFSNVSWTKRWHNEPMSEWLFFLFMYKLFHSSLLPENSVKQHYITVNMTAHVFYFRSSGPAQNLR